MAKSPFSIKLPFEPAGDQPKAIKQLYNNLKHGVKEQVLLGATGTGKSLHPEEYVLIGEKFGENIQWFVKPISEVFDELSNRFETILVKNEYITYLPEDRFFTLSFNPKTFKEEIKPLYAITKHKENRKLLKIKFSDGRSIITTQDHNFYVLKKDEGFGLYETKQLKERDFVPIPRSPFIKAKEPIKEIYITDYIERDKSHIYFECEEENYEKLYSGERLTQKEARAKNQGETGVPLKLLKNQIDKSEIALKTNTSKNQLHNKIVLDRNFLEFLGIYIAEGFSNGKTISISTDENYYKNLVVNFLEEFGLEPYFHKYDIKANNVILAEFLGNLAGKKSGDKKLPQFFLNLSDKQLGHLLRAVFDGDGTVEKDAITLTTKSKKLANDILYALLRLGIWGRVRKIFKKATNTNHKGDSYYQITISGVENIKLYLKHIGFNIKRKLKKAKILANKEYNTNVDLIPFTGKSIKELREENGLFQKDILAKRQTLSAVEIEKRNPSYKMFVEIIKSFEERDISAYNLKKYSNLRWNRIENIEEIEFDDYVYDFSVRDNETFLAGFGGVFVHNTFTIANVIEKYGKPALVLTHNKTLAAQLYRELKELFPDNAVEYFVSYYDYYQPEAYVPEKDLYIEKDSSINDAIDRLRHSATKSLIERPDTIVVASVSCIYGLGTPEFYEKLRLHLYVGQQIDRQELLKKLVELQYLRDDFSFKRGTFRVKGDTVEIIPSHAEDRIIRVEFFGDEIDNITEIDLFNRDIKQKLNTTVIFPASHYVIPRPDMVEAIKQIQIDLEKEVEEFRRQGKEIEANRLWQRTNYDIEMMLELGTCKGIENYSRYFDGRKPGEAPYTLMDYFPDDYLLIVDESHVTIPQVRAMYNGDRRRKENLVKYGWRMKSAYDNRPLKFEEFLQKIERAIYVSATPADWEIERSKGIIVEQIIRPTGLLDPEIEVRPTEGQIDDLINEIWNIKERGERAIVITLTKKMAENLADYLEERDIKAIYLHSEIDTIERAKIIKELREGKYDVIVGVNLLREGIDMPEVSLVAVLDADKQGFLRSTTALIQIIGRAARNVHGKAILYADKITPAMEKAIEETNRRRKIQQEYNEKHGITPKSVKKEIKELISLEEIGIYEYADYIPEDVETEEDLMKKIEELEKQMWKAAENWEFEKAAELRDQIEKLRKLVGVVK
ncbi:excinuclease ABC subunit UvrB [Persephonella sp. IF05-L8]|uniref:excinuclease ABC subunit UvrB n=1 Tax=Persephonella sp. IF05-L8 TaxID=1158338 RepID=UPI0009DFD3C4